MQTQAERLAAALLKVKPDVTAEDRAEAVKETGCTKATISKYLNGQVKDNDTGVTLLNFFRNRIAKREKAIA